MAVVSNVVSANLSLTSMKAFETLQYIIIIKFSKKAIISLILLLFLCFIALLGSTKNRGFHSQSTENSSNSNDLEPPCPGTLNSTAVESTEI